MSNISDFLKDRKVPFTVSALTGNDGTRRESFAFSERIRIAVILELMAVLKRICFIMNSG